MKAYLGSMRTASVSNPPSLPPPPPPFLYLSLSTIAEMRGLGRVAIGQIDYIILTPPTPSPPLPTTDLGGFRLILGVEGDLISP
jgi:hypothetical protein